ncbi:MAG: ABC transporter permease [Clostridiales bacterium]|nr:ABC transporter permease [Clostridiales bacterium]
MKQFKTILGFELTNYFKNKIFVGVTLFLVAVIAVVMFFPRLSAALTSEESAEQERAVMLVETREGENAALIEQTFAAAFPAYEVHMSGFDVTELQAPITAGEADCAFFIESLTSYTYYVNNLSLYDTNTDIADEALRNIYRVSAMSAQGLPADEAAAILSAPIEHRVETFGKDQFQNYFYTYIMIFALYMVILLYGQMVAMSVATEKSSRAMEVLITSARPVAMMFGKVIAACLAGLVQLVCIFGSAFFFFRINQSDWGDNPIIHSIFNMPAELLLYMLLFFVLGFLIYAFLYGAVGSTASKLEDINTSVMPITMLFIIAFMVVIFSMSSGNVDNIWMLICSYIPFTSPMAMFTRIAMSTVPVYEIVISIAILIGSVFGVGVLSAKIYRVGVLLYGTTPKIGSVLKSVWKA